MRVQSSKDFGANRLKVLIYGDSGHGKTTLAKTLNDVLIISVESGLQSISDTSLDVIDTTLNDKGEIIPRPERDVRLVQVYTYLQTPEAQNKYKTIFIDSLSEINDNLIEKYQLVYPDKKDSFNLWGEVAKSMAALIRAFRDLPYYNVVFTALEAQDKDENGRFFKGPLLKPKSFGEDAPKFFDYVWFMLKAEGEKPKLLTQPTETIRAKSRITPDIKLNQWEEPDLAMIFNKIKNVKQTVAEATNKGDKNVSKS